MDEMTGSRATPCRSIRLLGLLVWNPIVSVGVSVASLLAFGIYRLVQREA